MKRLIKWWKAEPKIKKRERIKIDPVTMESVQPAELPNHQLEHETKSALGDLAQAVVTLARTSYELRQATGRSALAQMTGVHRR